MFEDIVMRVHKKKSGLLKNTCKSSVYLLYLRVHIDIFQYSFRLEGVLYE
jgi:hypothetical protein